MAAPSPARLSNLSTTTLTKILELTRTRQLGLEPSPSLAKTIAKNLSSLHHSIGLLERQSAGSTEPVLEGLQKQYARLVELVQGLGVQLEHEPTSASEGQLISTQTEEEQDHLPTPHLTRTPVSPSLPQPEVLMPPAPTVRVDKYYDDPSDALEMDDEEMRRANQDVAQLQQRMMADQDDTLDRLSQAISRQRDLSMTISTELESQALLLEDTDTALDSTSDHLRRARGRLDQVGRKAKDNQTLCFLITVIILLLILIVILKF
ncbi:uncharacterized protein L969DRAFT_57322 [Mixia osmundae IAM 14324]|uniref:t-SNARE coiled-coil homology domain-containing protein n=1 Tax=Mixia osmundae (strain CBS 9802 / IAM 14324 / JCM 22182 / KY 12970) TaxID=764103 RepID=G7DZB1_MIXOS|nr:uncharacterized protein L969DRAFT_57322 [Mixia osmundae IAM 14324]KEI42613.1 hypothetical protein L969DRAFT_57322 [Mixia osmundae IAM 14324]GAA95921.1 hypothetical protein E5Q_02579 [Mixia osmundae IAM 14324]